MVKSSSLESLHNMVAHKIKREVSGVGVQGVGLRRPAAIDHSLSHPSHGRGVPSKSDTHTHTHTHTVTHSHSG